MKLSKDFLCSALLEVAFVGGERIDCQEVTVSLDSRTITSGEFFIALKGPSFDGHDFVADAFARGACGALVSKDYDKKALEKIHPAPVLVVVPDTLQAFIDLAKAWRKQLTCPVVGISGSVGKTSTKEMIRSILEHAGVQAYVSFKNYNNIFGLCYNILCIPLSCQVAIIEVGINEIGEMTQLADILRPSIGLLTCVAHAHLAGLGDSVQTVAYEKRQLFAFFTPKDVGIICGDQQLLSDVHYSHPIARFGMKIRNQVQARKVVLNTHESGKFTTTFIMKWYGKKASVRLQGNHQGFINNALAASTVAYFLQVSFDALIKGLEAYAGVENRFEMKPLKDNKGMLFDDCYNANPESMKAAIIAFSQFKSVGPKIAVLGDMLELGKKEAYWHRQIGRVISKSSNLDKLILVGDRARMIGRTSPMHMPVEFVQNWQEAQLKLEHMLNGTDALVLVKASHGMELAKMVQQVVA